MSRDTRRVIWILSVSLLMLVFCSTSFGIILPVPKVKQEQDQWCWAGSSKAVLAYYGTAARQCDIANFAWDVDYCCANPSSSGCNQPNYMYGTTGSLQAILSNWGVNSEGRPYPLSQGAVASETNAGRPFLIRWGWTTGGGHAVVGRGIVQSTVYYMDPWYGDHYSRTYSSTVRSPDRTWTHTLQVTAPHQPPPPGRAVQKGPKGLISNNTPAYQWYAVSDDYSDTATSADFYLLAVSDSTGGWPVNKLYSRAEVGCSAGGTCSIKPVETLWAGECKWYVQTYNSATGMWGPWSNGMVFAVPDKRPGGTVPGLPSGRTENTQPVYTWNAVPNAEYYRVAVSDLKGGWAVDKWYSKAEANCSSGSGACRVVSPILAPGAYTWGLVTYNSYGYGPWSSWNPFNILVPGKINLQSPTSVINTNNPSFKWDAEPYAESYRLAVGDATHWPIDKWYSKAEANCGSGTGTCWVTPAAELTSGVCMWYIQASNSHGAGPWSDRMLFTTLGQATQISPKDTISTYQPTFTWNAVSNADYYRLAVNDANGGWPIDKWYSKAEANCSSGIGTCSVANPAGLAAGQYKWYTLTWNHSGYGQWSDAMAFAVFP